MLTFRTSITGAVMAFIVALAALLIAIQERALHLATKEAASAYMDAASAKALGRLQTEISTVASLVDVLATSSSVADFERTNRDRPGYSTVQSGAAGITSDRQRLCRFRKWRVVTGARHWRA